jgi:hypothetical protein
MSMRDSISTIPSEVGFCVGRLRLEPDLAQRPAGLGTPRILPRFAQGGNKGCFDVHATRYLEQATQPFAGRQHQIVASGFDETRDPGFDRRGIRSVADDEHRALQHIRPLFSE